MPYAVADDAAALAGLQSGEVTVLHTTLADQLVDALMNRVPDGFTSKTATSERHDIPISGTRNLLLNHHPVIAITTVVVDAQASNPTTLDSTNYVEDDGILKLVTPPTSNAGIEWVSSFPQGIGMVEVTYNYGFASVPALIIQLANVIAGQLGKNAVQAASQPASGATRIRIGDYEEQFGTDPDAMTKMLKGSHDVLLNQAIATYREYRY